LIRVAICGKYTKLHDSYASVIEAVRHSGAHIDGHVVIDWLDTDALGETAGPAAIFCAESMDIVPGGLALAASRGKIQASSTVAENGVPFWASATACSWRSWNMHATRSVCPARIPPKQREDGFEVADPVV